MLPAPRVRVPRRVRSPAQGAAFARRPRRHRRYRVGSKLVFTQLTGFDEVSAGFAFTVALTSTDLEVDADDVLGQPMAIEAESGDPKRWFHGIVSAFRLVKVEERLAHYEAELRPWLWRLGLTHDCRVFQNLSVVEIIEEIFGKYPDAKFEKRLQETYEPREYCVQFDETDLAFVQRLMEHEGIFYFFEYAEDGHTLVLTDAMAKLKPAEGYDDGALPLRGRRRAARPRLPVGLGGDQQLPAERPTPTPTTTSRSRACRCSPSPRPSRSPACSRASATASPGAHLDARPRRRAGRDPARGAAGAARAHPRRRHGPRPRRRAASSSSPAFRATTRTPQHLVLRADYRVVDPEFRAGIGADGETYRADFVVAPTALPYRPPRLTPHPVMRGPQTATVVGPAGEEIFTDKYARVKVQFHWDRLGKRDENSSCFVRVSLGLGRRGLGLHPDPAHRPGGDRRLPRGRPRPADHHRPGLQRRRDAALRPAGQRDPVGLEVELLARAAAATTS